MKLSLHVGKLNLSLGAERSTVNSEPGTIKRSYDPIRAWLRGEDLDASNASLVAPFQQSVWVYTAVCALAQTISAIPFRISQGDRSGENLLTKGPVVDLFNRPHPYLNRFRFWEFIVTWYCLRGEAFIVALDKSGAVLPIKSPRLRVSASPIYEPRGPRGRPTLDGYDVIWTEVLAPYAQGVANANACLAVFGDLSYWWMGEHLTPRIDTSDQVFFVNDQLAVRFIEEIDFDYMDIQAASALKTAAA